nr:LOW QUALITY PROTEIN: selenoprotein S [Loxodonta africana]
MPGSRQPAEPCSSGHEPGCGRNLLGLRVQLAEPRAGASGDWPRQRLARARHVYVGAGRKARGFRRRLAVGGRRSMKSNAEQFPGAGRRRGYGFCRHGPEARLVLSLFSFTGVRWWYPILSLLKTVFFFSVGSLLATYGWYLVLSGVLLFVVIQKLSARLRALRQRHLDRAAAAVEPDVIVKQQEALAAARLKMQEELNAQAEKYKEKLRQLEEEKRRQKIEMWDSMQEGKSYRGNARKPQEEDNPGPSTSSVLPKRKPDRRPLRGGGYNPLSGEGGGTAPGGLGAEDRRLADEAKSLVSVV